MHWIGCGVPESAFKISSQLKLILLIWGTTLWIYVYAMDYYSCGRKISEPYVLIWSTLQNMLNGNCKLLNSLLALIFKGYMSIYAWTGTEPWPGKHRYAGGKRAHPSFQDFIISHDHMLFFKWRPIHSKTTIIIIIK